MNKEYLGDGVYAEIESFQVKLTTGRSQIYLERSVFLKLKEYFEKNKDEVQ